VNLEAKAGPVHYVTMGLVILGLWYLLRVIEGKSGAVSSPLADTTVDVTSLVIFGG
jgi:hypothetical protein